MDAALLAVCAVDKGPFTMSKAPPTHTQPTGLHCYPHPPTMRQRERSLKIQCMSTTFIFWQWRLFQPKPQGTRRTAAHSAVGQSIHVATSRPVALGTIPHKQCYMSAGPPPTKRVKIDTMSAPGPLKCKKLTDLATVPVRQSALAAGYDLCR